MKKKLIALVCALALAVGLVGCSLSTPDSVGTIGDVDIPSGLYLLAQFDAYQTAADLASDEQDASKVSSFLKATITVDDATGETAVVSDYVAQKTLENLESYAAIETRFDALGGVLTPDEEAQADSYASQLMEQNGDLYKGQRHRPRHPQAVRAHPHQEQRPAHPLLRHRRRDPCLRR